MRGVPFLMVPARQHFVVYDRIPQGIVVLAILHQVRDIESLIVSLSASFLHEVEKLKATRAVGSPKRSKRKKRQ